MKTGYTHITVVLDDSGSMGSIYNDTVGGFNTFLKSQKEIPGEATLSMFYLNNNKVNGLTNIGQIRNRSEFEFISIKEIPELSKLNYNVGGTTPLLDTLGEAIKKTGDTLNLMNEESRPEKVLFVIITDGEENSSWEFKYEDISKMISEQTNTYKWEFMYLGANQDAIAAASKMGIDLNRSMSYGTSKSEIGSTYSILNSKLTSYRSLNTGAAGAALDFNDVDRTTSKVS